MSSLPEDLGVRLSRYAAPHCHGHLCRCRHSATRVLVFTGPRGADDGRRANTPASGRRSGRGDPASPEQCRYRADPLGGGHAMNSTEEWISEIVARVIDGAGSSSPRIAHESSRRAGCVRCVPEGRGRDGEACSRYSDWRGAGGFWGDNLDAPFLLARDGGLDVLTLEYLAELTLAILSHLRARDPAKGYVGDFPELLAQARPLILREQEGLTVVTNAGGLNPPAWRRRSARTDALSIAAGLADDLPLAVVEGDDILDAIPGWVADGVELDHMETGRPIDDVVPKLVSANAYLGARPIAGGLSGGARVVLTGRVADASLTLGPAAAHFGWAWDDWPRLAGASAAGHVIECGAQATGGIWHRWDEVPDLAGIGYPIAEVRADGSSVITKPEGTGGLVSVGTVSEQLVYEIDDPARYRTPDVDVDLTTVRLGAGRHRPRGRDRGAGESAVRYAEGGCGLPRRLDRQRDARRDRARRGGQGARGRADRAGTGETGRVRAGRFAGRMPRRRRGRARCPSPVRDAVGGRLAGHRPRPEPGCRRTVLPRVRPAGHLRPAGDCRVRLGPADPPPGLRLLADARPPVAGRRARLVRTAGEWAETGKLS